MYKFDLSLLKSRTTQPPNKAKRDRAWDLPRRRRTTTTMIPNSPTRTGTPKTDDLTRSTRSSRSTNTFTTTSTAEASHHPPGPTTTTMMMIHPLTKTTGTSLPSGRFHLPRKTKVPSKTCTIGIQRHELKRSRSMPSVSVGGVLRNLRQTFQAKDNTTHSNDHEVVEIQPEEDAVEIVTSSSIKGGNSNSSSSSSVMEEKRETAVVRSSGEDDNDDDDDDELVHLRNLMQKLRAETEGNQKLLDEDNYYDYSSDEDDDDELLHKGFRSPEISPVASEVSPAEVFGDLMMFVSNERKILEYTHEEFDDL